MSWVATAIIVGAVSTGFKIHSEYEMAKSNARALEAEGNLRMEQRQERTKRMLASQKASFLSSGITLNGEDTPIAVLGYTADTGIKDMGLIRSNYNSRIKNVWRQARSQMISDLGNFAMSAGMVMASPGAGANTGARASSSGFGAGLGSGVPSGFGAGI